MVGSSVLQFEQPMPIYNEMKTYSDGAKAVFEVKVLEEDTFTNDKFLDEIVEIDLTKQGSKDITLQGKKCSLELICMCKHEAGW